VISLSVGTNIPYKRHGHTHHGRNNAASRSQNTSAVSQAATLPKDQSEGDGDGIALSLPMDTDSPNIAAVDTASFSETSPSDPVQAYLASTLATASSTQHLDPFHLSNQDALVNNSHLGHSSRFTVDSNALNSSRDYMDIL